MLSRLFLVAALSALCLCTSCQYHAGRPGGNCTVCLESVSNQTDEPTLGSQFRQAFQEALFRHAGVTLRDADDADVSVSLRLTRADSHSLARAELRGKRDREDDSNAYQAVLHRLTVDGEAIIIRNSDGKEIFRGKVRGTGDMPRQADRNTALQPAIQQAANDIALQIVAYIQNDK
jgi:hypothetical protein